MDLTKVITTIFRTILEVVAKVVYTVKYWNISHKPLPPITNKLLLESACSLAEKIRNGKVSSIELVNVFIERIKITNPSLNAVIETRFELAIEEAKKVDEYLRENPDSIEEIGISKPFFGVPLTVKENLKLKGFHLTVGLYARKDNIADVDAEAVKILRDAGFIVLGKTNVPELVMWWETYNTVYGKTNNPYDIRRMVGGSSGGEGSIISAAGAPMGIGSDILGSIRMPAHFNGIFGHKASTGTINNVGLEPNFSKTYDVYRTTGPLCRFACDLRPILKLLTSSHKDLINFDRKVDMKNLKIYYMENNGNSLTTPVSEELVGALRKTLDYFKSTYNVTCEKVNLPEFKYSLPMILMKMGEDPNMPTPSEQLTDGKSDLMIEWELLKMMFIKSRYTFPSLMVALIQKYFRADRKSKRYQNTTDRFNSLKKTMEEMLTENVIFLYPPNATTAVYHYETHFKPLGFLYTGIFNMLGLPATISPVGLSSSGLPLSVQIIGGLYQDNLCISVAEEIERAFGGWVCPSEIQ